MVTQRKRGGVAGTTRPVAPEKEPPARLAGYSRDPRQPALFGASFLASGTLRAALSFGSLAPTLVVGCIFLIRPLFVPAREIVAAGERSHSERWRVPALKFAGWLLTGVVFSVFGVFLGKWLG